MSMSITPRHINLLGCLPCRVQSGYTIDGKHCNEVTIKSKEDIDPWSTNMAAVYLSRIGEHLSVALREKSSLKGERVRIQSHDETTLFEEIIDDHVLTQNKNYFRFSYTTDSLTVIQDDTGNLSGYLQDSKTTLSQDELSHIFIFFKDTNRIEHLAKAILNNDFFSNKDAIIFTKKSATDLPVNIDQSEMDSSFGSHSFTLSNDNKGIQKEGTKKSKVNLSALLENKSGTLNKWVVISQQVIPNLNPSLIFSSSDQETHENAANNTDPLWNVYTSEKPIDVTDNNFFFQANTHQINTFEHDEDKEKHTLVGRNQNKLTVYLDREENSISDIEINNKKYTDKFYAELIYKERVVNRSMDTSTLVHFKKMKDTDFRDYFCSHICYIEEKKSTPNRTYDITQNTLNRSIEIINTLREKTELLTVSKHPLVQKDYLDKVSLYALKKIQEQLSMLMKDEDIRTYQVLLLERYTEQLVSFLWNKGSKNRNDAESTIGSLIHASKDEINAISKNINQKLNTSLRLEDSITLFQDRPNELDSNKTNIQYINSTLNDLGISIRPSINTIATRICSNIKSKQDENQKTLYSSYKTIKDYLKIKIIQEYQNKEEGADLRTQVFSLETFLEGEGLKQTDTSESRDRFKTSLIDIISHLRTKFQKYETALTRIETDLSTIENNVETLVKNLVDESLNQYISFISFNIKSTLNLFELDLNQTRQLLSNLCTNLDKDTSAYEQLVTMQKQLNNFKKTKNPNDSLMELEDFLLYLDQQLYSEILPKEIQTLFKEILTIVTDSLTKMAYRHSSNMQTYNHSNKEQYEKSAVQHYWHELSQHLHSLLLPIGNLKYLLETDRLFKLNKVEYYYGSSIDGRHITDGSPIIIVHLTHQLSAVKLCIPLGPYYYDPNNTDTLTLFPTNTLTEQDEKTRKEKIEKRIPLSEAFNRNFIQANPKICYPSDVEFDCETYSNLYKRIVINKINKNQEFETLQSYPKIGPSGPTDTLKGSVASFSSHSTVTSVFTSISNQINGVGNDRKTISAALGDLFTRIHNIYNDYMLGTDTITVADTFSHVLNDIGCKKKKKDLSLSKIIEEEESNDQSDDELSNRVYIKE